MYRVVIAAVLACLTTAASAQPARVEIHPVATRTPTDQQFLTGSREAPAAVIAGTLSIPAGAARAPVVVLLHGSGGVSPNVLSWVGYLNAAGVATFTLDSFSGRGIVSTVADQDRLSRLAMIFDAYRALETLAAHPRIDPQRVALMGFSRGGGAAHWAAIERFRLMHAGQSTARYALHIAFYPTCNREFRDGLALAAPVRYIHGTADDYIPIKECRDLVARLKAAGQNAEMIEVEGAHHVFDAPAGSPTRLDNAQTTRDCPMISENPVGLLVNSQNGSPFTYAGDPCVVRGTTAGRDGAGFEQARTAVRQILQSAGFIP